MADSSPPPDRRKPAALRFTYKSMAKCELESGLIEIELMNISGSGIQFASRIQISTREPVVVRWTDPNFGEFDPTFLIVREIHKPEVKDFCYFYGAQYTNLSAQTKQNLVVLIKSFKEEESKETQESVQKATPEYLMKVIDQGQAFLSAIMAGKSEPYFQKLVESIKPYEREAFQKDNSLNKSIQKMAYHVFILEVFKILGLQIANEKQEFSALYFEKFHKEFEAIYETENNVESELKKLATSEYAEDVQKSFRQSLNESSNRLYYTRQNILIAIYEIFDPLVKKHLKLSGPFMPIQAEYDKMNLAKTAFQEEVQIQPTKFTKAKEFTKSTPVPPSKSTDFISIITSVPPKYLISMIIAFFILLVVVFSGGKPKKKMDISADIGIKTKTLNNVKAAGQLNLVMDNSWSQLSDIEKDNELSKIMIYLREDKTVTSAVIMDHEMNVVKMLNE